ncbi:MAG: flagellar basal-body rod protein FlgG [Firmicutes bacterium]|nr:flagellar basal-body rod protein FlgG [Bacillota bacterium]
MLGVFKTGATGLIAQQLAVDTVSNNLANANTPGFKKSRVDFGQLLQQDLKNNGIPVSRGNGEAVEPAHGGGVKVVDSGKIFAPGEIINTNRPFDLAVLGDGYFLVRTPEGEARYTRDGSFEKDNAGNLVSANGYILEGVKLPEKYDKVVIKGNGEVMVESAEGTTAAGRIRLYVFNNPDGLSAVGENMYVETWASNAPIAGTAGAGGFGSIAQGSLEAANVEPVEEVTTMLDAQRAYSFNARTMRTADEMWGMANNLRK